jgi:hypothetical protein
MADFVPRIYHVRGHPEGLADDIKAHAALLESTGKLAATQEYTAETLAALFRSAEDGDVFIYDGHGSEDGSIYLQDAVPLTGSELREMVASTQANVHVYLNTCFSSLVAAHGQNEEYLRNIIAKVLMYDPSSSENVNGEVDRYMALVRQGGDDDDDLAKRVGFAIRSVGLDRFATIFPDRIAPVSIGSMNVDPDPVLVALGLVRGG